MKEKQLLDVDLSTFSYKVLRQEQWSTFLITGDNLKINYCLYKLIERVYNQQDIKHQFIPAFTCHLSTQSKHGAAHTFFSYVDGSRTYQKSHQDDEDQLFIQCPYTYL